jgi:SAM-dependent methyltransferase
MSASICSGDAARAAYDAAAPVYDEFTSHHDYELWVPAILGLAARFGLRAGSVLDVGCGTGKSFEPYVTRGWDVVGCDVSPAMLSRARARAGGVVRLSLADARALPVLGRFDLVQALDDVVNYLAPDELAPFLRGARANLAPDGLLVFDLNTVRSYRSFFASTSVVEEPDAFIVWRGSATSGFAGGDVARAALDGFVRAAGDGCWRHVSGEHVQFHHPLDRVTSALSDAGLSLLGAFGQDYSCDFTADVDELRDTKALIIARRDGAPDLEEVT